MNKNDYFFELESPEKFICARSNSCKFSSIHILPLNFVPKLKPKLENDNPSPICLGSSRKLNELVDGFNLNSDMM